LCDGIGEALRSLHNDKGLSSGKLEAILALLSAFSASPEITNGPHANLLTALLLEVLVCLKDVSYVSCLPALLLCISLLRPSSIASIIAEFIIGCQIGSKYPLVHVK
jgi:hypothetical protein